MKIFFLFGVLTAMAAALPQANEKMRQFLDAVRKGDLAAVRSALQGDPALVNARGDDGVPAVRLAFYYRQPEMAKLLLERGPTLDVHDAAAAGQTARLRELLAAHPEQVNQLSADGATALGLAAFFSNVETVELLLNNGAHINQTATNPAFPFAALHSAMSAGHRDIVDLLLARGADVNVREGGGLTVLHEAAGLGNLDYIKLLLAKGANPRAKTDDGKLPKDFARERKFPEAADLLARAAAGKQ